MNINNVPACRHAYNYAESVMACDRKTQCKQTHALTIAQMTNRHTFGKDALAFFHQPTTEKVKLQSISCQLMHNSEKLQ